MPGRKAIIRELLTLILVVIKNFESNY